MKRIQRKRTKGWRMPPNTVYVGRWSKWANPFRIGIDGNAQDCVELYRHYIRDCHTSIRDELRGKDLCCWCPLDQPCHVDVLLEIANAGGDAHGNR